MPLPLLSSSSYDTRGFPNPTNAQTKKNCKQNTSQKKGKKKREKDIYLYRILILRTLEKQTTNKRLAKNLSSHKLYRRQFDVHFQLNVWNVAYFPLADALQPLLANGCGCVISSFLIFSGYRLPRAYVICEPIERYPFISINSKCVYMKLRKKKNNGRTKSI